MPQWATSLSGSIIHTVSMTAFLMALFPFLLWLLP